MTHKSFLVAAAALSMVALSGSAALAADTVVIAGGPSGGGYDGLARSLGAELQKKGFTVEVRITGGSEDNLDGLEDGTFAYAAAQQDIHYMKGKDDPNIATRVIPVAVLYNEAMTLVCSRSSGYDELSDLDAGDTVIVGPIGSGSALTWDNIVGIEKEYGNGSSWAKASPVYEDLDTAAASLAVGTAKCAFGVGKVPIQWASDVVGQGGVVSWVYDKDINDLEFNGASLYEPVRIPAGAYPVKFDTYKVPAILFRSQAFVNPKVDALVKRVAPALGGKVQGTVR